MKGKKVKHTREEIENMVGRIAIMTLEGDEITTRMNMAIERFRAVRQKRLDEIKELIKEMTKSCKKWADNNPEEFGKSRSIEMLHGIIGFRKGNMALVVEDGKTEEEALAWMQKYHNEYVRVETSLMKDALIADRDQIPEILIQAGLEIEQKEKFYVEPKQESFKPELKV